jgi:AraC-like DNA-binding protein
MQITAPDNYQMFILVNSNTLNSIVLIQDDYIRQIDPSYSLATSENNRQIVYESKIINNRLTLFYQEAKTDYPGREILLSDLARIITSLLLRGVARPVVAKNESRKSKGVEQAIDYIKNNYHKKVTLSELANQVNYSQFHFIRIFQKETGKTPFEYLTDIRVNKAKEFLSTTNQSITEICLQCGLQNSSHFANFFKSHTGVSPSEFRQNLE